MSPASNNLKDIPIYARTEETYSVGNIRALLSEIATCLEKLVKTGNTGMIDLNSLPLAPGEYEQLRQTLGQGEISARIEAIGPSEIMSKIRLSSVGEYERVSDSVQPVHSWNDSHITDGRLALISASAIAFAVPGGSAIIDAIAAAEFQERTAADTLLRETFSQGFVFVHCCAFSLSWASSS